MDIKDIKIRKPLILVETDKIIAKGTSNNFSAKVIKTAEESAYKVGSTIYTEANYFIPFVIDDFTFENTFIVNEGTVKGEINA